MSGLRFRMWSLYRPRCAGERNEVIEISVILANIDLNPVHLAAEFFAYCRAMMIFKACSSSLINSPVTSIVAL
jgi:hypothetical protein